MWMRPQRGGSVPGAGTLAIPAAMFDELASGGGDPAAMAFLNDVERSRRLILLREVMSHCAVSPEPAVGPLLSLDRAWDALISAENASKEVVDDILLSPTIGIWIGHMLRRLGGTARVQAPLWVDAGHIFAIGAAAAVRAGTRLDVRVPVRNGGIMFPTLGLALVGTASPNRAEPDFTVADVTVANGRITVACGRGHMEVEPKRGVRSAHWLGLRECEVAAGSHRVRLLVDDVDPFRELSEPAEPDRLANADFDRWDSLIAQAVKLLQEEHEYSLAAFSKVMRSLVPLPGPVVEPVRSASSGDAFGSMLASRPPDAVSMAETMIHEFQHVKLGALLHLFPFLEHDDHPRWYAPWRPDPRPLSGLLQGAYAFLGIAQFWQARRACVHGRESARAEFEFALRRQQIWQVLKVLRDCPLLTGPGRRFVRCMTASCTTLFGDRVPTGVARAAWMANMSHRVEWRIRNLSCSADTKSAIREAWHRRDIAMDTAIRPLLTVADDVVVWFDGRYRMYRDLVTFGPCAVVEECESDNSDPCAAADRLLVAGNADEAGAGYIRRLRESPFDHRAWSGWILARATAAPKYRRLLKFPELILEGISATGSSTFEDLEEYVEWLCLPRRVLV